MANFLRMAKGEAGQGQFATPVGVYCAVWAVLTAIAFVQTSAAQAQRANARYRVQETRPRWVFSQVLAGSSTVPRAQEHVGRDMASAARSAAPRHSAASPAVLGSSPYSGPYSPLPVGSTPGSFGSPPTASPPASRGRFWDGAPGASLSPQLGSSPPGPGLGSPLNGDESFDTPARWTKGALVGTRTPSQ